MCYFDIKKYMSVRTGFYISYNIEEKGEGLKIEDLDILGLPYLYSPHNLGLFHFILEICEYFLPLNGEAYELYEFIKGLYKNNQFFDNNYLGSFVGNPTEVALIRMTSDGRLPVEQRRGYTSVFNAVARIFREEGVLTLWRVSYVLVHNYSRFFAQRI